MRMTLTDLTCLVALLASVVVASPAQAGGRQIEPFATPLVLDGSAVLPTATQSISQLSAVPGFRLQRPAVTRTPTLPLTCGLGLRLGLRF